VERSVAAGHGPCLPRCSELMVRHELQVDTAGRRRRHDASARVANAARPSIGLQDDPALEPLTRPGSGQGVGEWTRVRSPVWAGHAGLGAQAVVGEVLVVGTAWPDATAGADSARITLGGGSSGCGRAWGAISRYKVP
jgi:hypothetical protein